MRRHRYLAILLLVSGLAAAATTNATDEAIVVDFPKPGLGAAQLGVIVNDADPDSVAIAAYYMKKRAIPERNLIHVRFAPGRAVLPAEEFARLKRSVDDAADETIQAYALTWAEPYRVECMSITAAFAFGFDRAYCASGCKPTRASPYFNSDSALPFTRLRIRPSMSLAAANVAEARRLIDRGVAADGENPQGTAYLVSTRDVQRNVRAAGYAQARTLLAPLLPVEIVDTDRLADRHDVMFYFTGLTQVPDLASNTYLPGAIADHLTSAGGVLFGGAQMSILKWLEAGATGSYGAVVEPCNFPQKFPVPALVMAHYLQGETLLEAYWKSVQMPGQGLFVGEPLARPFATWSSRYANGALQIETPVIEPGVYSVQASGSMMGPYREVARVAIQWGSRQLRLSPVAPGYYRFVRVTPEAQMR